MTTDPTSPERKSLKYAEDLGLNSVYETALNARKSLVTAIDALTGLRDDRRRLETYKYDIEMEVMEEERGANPDMSAAAFEKHLKVVYSNNADIRETRDRIGDVTGQIDLLEHEVDLLNADIKIAVARLHELGGYFQFMAVIKQASVARKAKESDRENPWK